jgi:hypothetical protein
MTPDMRNSALLILGMHRSGTSALAGVLSMCGVEPGPRLMPGVADVNPKGFWEHQDIFAIHERLLADLGSSWDDERPLPANWWHSPRVEKFKNELSVILRRDFSGASHWLVKDPRLSRLVPLWLELLNDLEVEPHFVICLRHPQEVAASLERRDGIVAERGCLLWLDHFITSEHDTRGLNRVLVTYDQLLADWRQSVAQISETFDIDLPVDELKGREIDAFLEPSLRHHQHGLVAQSGQTRYCTLATEAYSLATIHSLEKIHPRFDELRKESVWIAALVAPWIAEIAALKSRKFTLETAVLQTQAANADLRAEIHRVKSSFSWQITKPVRLLTNLPRHLRGWRRSHSRGRHDC